MRGIEIVLPSREFPVELDGVDIIDYETGSKIVNANNIIILVRPHNRFHALVTFIETNGTWSDEICEIVRFRLA